MSAYNQTTQVRSRKLGLLIQDVRIARNRPVELCAKAMGVSLQTYEQIELGQTAPTLPELEAFAFYLDTPLEHFWSSQTLSGQSVDEPAELSTQYLSLRHKIIGARLRMARSNLNLSLSELSQSTTISEEIIHKYEMGEKSVPLPELEILANRLQIRMEDLYDQRGLIGQWREEKLAVQRFLELPPEIREFLCQPVNLPYLQLAMRLSDLSVEKLRNVAEGLLEITY
jgi:transcriptional regulator with XRE-family HTH domain